MDLLRVIAERAEQDIDYIMPGYTHLQRAQVVRTYESKGHCADCFLAYTLESLAS